MLGRSQVGGGLVLKASVEAMAFGTALKAYNKDRDYAFTMMVGVALSF